MSSFSGFVAGDQVFLGEDTIRSKDGRFEALVSSDQDINLDNFELEQFLQACDFGFAFAIYDRSKNQLILAKDKLGTKELYFAVQNGRFFFATSIKNIIKNQHFNRDLNQEILPLYFRHGYIPSPYTIFKDIYKLRSGSYKIVEINSSFDSQDFTYYRVADKLANRFEGSFDQAALKTRELLTKSITKSINKPFAAFLSGGVDSSLISALSQELNGSQIDTYCAGFWDKQFDESPYAKAVADRLKTNHHTLMISEKEAFETVEKLPFIYDEPFSDSSQIATHLVIEKMKKHTDIALSGDGSDESFYGYERYKIARKIENIPAKNTLANLLMISRKIGINKALQAISKNHPIFKRLEAIEELLNIKSSHERYRFILSLFRDKNPLIGNTKEPIYNLNSPDQKIIDSEHSTMLLALDITNYLIDDGFVKVNDAANYEKLIIKSPFLDIKTVEFALSLPYSMRIKNGRGKAVLRKILSEFIPEELINRPKTGFGVPIDSWLRNGLKTYAQNALDHASDYDHLFDKEFINKLWAHHQKGTNNGAYIWNILSLKNYLKIWL